jgi:hypothetical protein
MFFIVIYYFTNVVIFIGIYKLIMKKRISITRDQLVEHIRKSISKNLMEQDYSSDMDRPTQPREKGVKTIFGDKYSRYIPNDVIRYMRKNPALIFERLFELYGEDAYMYLDKAKEKMGDSSEPMMEQDMDDDNEGYQDDEEEQDPLMDTLKDVVNNDGEFSESDIDDIFDYGGSKRSFRGSIYLDGMVPETDDKEFDRKVAMKIMEFFASGLNINKYVGGVGFKQRSITDPFDNENF